MGGNIYNEEHPINKGFLQEVYKMNREMHSCVPQAHPGYRFSDQVPPISAFFS